MSTRGLMGFTKNGTLKAQYNHFDSYIEGLGKDIFEVMSKIAPEERVKKLNEVYDRLVMIKERDGVTEELLAVCKKANLVDLSVSNRSDNDLYCVLRQAQGNLQLYLDGFLYMLDGGDFINDDIWCEWAYIFNLDTNKFEIYRPMGGKDKVFEVDITEMDYEKALAEVRF